MSAYPHKGKDVGLDEVAQAVLMCAQEEVESGKDAIHEEFGLAHNPHHRYRSSALPLVGWFR